MAASGFRGSLSSAPNLQVPYPTRPPSPRKRRAIQRSSEEVDGIMSLNEYILRSDPYRFTYPYLDPAPMGKRPLLPDDPLWTSYGTLTRIAENEL